MKNNWNFEDRRKYAITEVAEYRKAYKKRSNQIIKFYKFGNLIYLKLEYHLYLFLVSSGLGVVDIYLHFLYDRLKIYELIYFIIYYTREIFFLIFSLLGITILFDHFLIFRDLLKTFYIPTIVLTLYKIFEIYLKDKNYFREDYLSLFQKIKNKFKL